MQGRATTVLLAWRCGHSTSWLCRPLARRAAISQGSSYVPHGVFGVGIAKMRQCGSLTWRHLNDMIFVESSPVWCDGRSVSPLTVTMVPSSSLSLSWWMCCSFCCRSWRWSVRMPSCSILYECPHGQASITVCSKPKSKKWTQADSISNTENQHVIMYPSRVFEACEMKKRHSKYVSEGNVKNGQCEKWPILSESLKCSRIES